MMSLEVVAHGEPAPQGSKNAYVRGGRVVLVESSTKVKPWRDLITLAVRQAAMRSGWNADDRPVAVSLIFTMPSPKALPKGIVLHTKRPDLDKLVRSTLDGITDAGNVWRDDSNVASLSAMKVYAGHDQALEHPGVSIKVVRLDS